MSAERDELATVIHRRICEESLSECLEDEGYCVKAAYEILAAGYRKQEVVIEWGTAHANGVVARTYRTDKAAQAFVESMAEVGHEMTVLRREYRPATYTEWEATK